MYLKSNTIDIQDKTQADHTTNPLGLAVCIAHSQVTTSTPDVIVIVYRELHEP